MQRRSAKFAAILWWVIATSAVLGVLALLSVGANTPAEPTLAGLPGFGEVAFQVTPAGGTAAQHCALLAETDEQRAKGLMGQRDLAGYDAMVFQFAADTTGPFYMRNVPVGLSIAWFGADGTFVSSTDMAPCGNKDDCPNYTATGPYRYAIEVLQGGLGELGIREGSTITVGGACGG